MKPTPAKLVLSDGTTFNGELFGFVPSSGLVSGEIVSNTAMSGYLEAISDPASTGQILCFTYPQIGNVGASPAAHMSKVGGAEGVVVRELVQRYSSWQATQSLEEALRERQQSVLSGVDTRSLTRHLHRMETVGAAYGVSSEDELRRAATNPEIIGTDLVSKVSTPEIQITATDNTPHIVVLDLGVRATTLARLRQIGRVTLVPSSSTLADIQALSPDGFFVSSGPGNPAVLSQPCALVAALVDKVPIMAVGLGAMVLALALGAGTHFLPRRHYGSNIPVRGLATNKVEITNQNRSWGITPGTIDNSLITHRNLNDGEVEGIRSASGLAQGVAYNPDLGPGPFDSDYLFHDFANLLISSASYSKGH